MKYLIISFQSKNNLMQFNQLLHSRNINTRIINTPHKISSSCSLSIKTDLSFLSIIESLLKQISLGGFLGLYSVNEFNGFSQVVKIL